MLLDSSEKMLLFDEKVKIALKKVLEEGFTVTQVASFSSYVSKSSVLRSIKLWFEIVQRLY